MTVLVSFCHLKFHPNLSRQEGATEKKHSVIPPFEKIKSIVLMFVIGSLLNLFICWL